MPTERFLFNALFGPDGLFRTALPDTTIVLATHAGESRYLKSSNIVVNVYISPAPQICGSHYRHAT